MNSLTRNSLILAAAFLPLTAAWGQETTLPAARPSPSTIRLVCANSYSLAENASPIERSGEELLTITYGRDGRAIITRLTREFRGLVTEEKITAEAEYPMPGVGRGRETIEINRFTGEYRRVFQINENPSVLFVGECKPAEPKF